ncbi:PaaX family transcriptional regulator [Planotetraspora mira]|uniref:PaaX family transcriptional regulator n=1 Tax=Planotetraspora mira TaxID=58121 RepID=A0A8J3TNH5_9ACTN|nr:PaaX family transcriptional regulator C-terminal domain-containing protein [Planotetraspora mira]GII30235.1 PaaX family transcriptional regulator [Planotetraspora mira]
MSTPASPTTAPTVSRRHAAGAESARGLLFTVLGEFVLPSGGSAWTSAFIDVLGRLGVEEKASRQALMRTAADGWLTSRRMGRRTLWTLSPHAERLLTEGAARIYGFQGTQREWDGRWLLVLARVPESDRPTRHVLRTRLEWAGFGSPAPGVWISTHPDRAAEAERVLGEAGVLDDAQIFLAEHRVGELARLVRQAWDLEAIEKSYEDFLAEFARQSSRDPLVRLVDLVHSWRRFPANDPALPGELLPARWSGARAADLFRRQHAKWTTAAAAEWRRLTEDAA